MSGFTLAGPGLMMLAALGFSIMHAIIQHLGRQGLHGFEIAFFRNLFGMFVIGPIILRHGLSVFRTIAFPTHMLRAGINALAMLMFFHGITLGVALGLVQSLGFTAPLFTSLLAALFLAERLRLHRWAALLIGFAGTLVILRPGIAEIPPGALYILMAALAWGVAMVIIKRLTRTDSAVTISAYMIVLLTPITGIAALFVWQGPTWAQLGWLSAVGILGTLSQLSFTQAFSLADATAVLPFDFTKLIWSALLGWILFAQNLDIWVWLGAAMIFSGGFYIAWRERKLGAAPPPPGEHERPV